MLCYSIPDMERELLAHGFSAEDVVKMSTSQLIEAWLSIPPVVL